MKSRKRTIGMAVEIAVVAVLLCALFWQVNRFKVKPSLYAEAAVRQGVTVQVETNWAKDEILYLLENHTAEQIEYAGYEVLEYYDGQAWQEVLYRMGGRASEQARDAMAWLLAPAGEAYSNRIGSVDLANRPGRPDGSYRLVFPGVREDDPVICSEPFSWGNGG
nr:hypothetical protein [uncultured Agathobaculum sp.]